MTEQDQRNREHDRRLAQRYGTRSRWPRVFVAVGVALALLLAGWLAWAVWVHSTPQVSSTLTRWSVTDAHSATATVDVRLAEGARSPRCLLRAYAEDHTVVGETVVPVTDGPEKQTLQIEIRTERLATSVDNVGCTSPDQARPR